MAGEIVVLVTCPDVESESLATALVEERLAACVNIVGGIRSIYFWEDKVCNETEQLLVIKSNRDNWLRLRDRVKELHSYEVPEIIALPIEDGYEPYIKWVNQSVAAGK